MACATGLRHTIWLSDDGIVYAVGVLGIYGGSAAFLKPKPIEILPIIKQIFQFLLMRMVLFGHLVVTILGS